MLHAHAHMVQFKAEVVRLLLRYGSLPLLKHLVNTRHAKQRYLFAGARVAGTAPPYTAPEWHRAASSVKY